MSTVYQHQLHAHKQRRRKVKRWLLVLVVLAAGGIWYGLQSLKPETVISQSKSTSKKITGNADFKKFNKGNFSIELPAGWQFTSAQKDIYTIYHFKSALTGEDGNRMIDVYEDSNLPNFAINRLLPVEATDEGGLITDAGMVSDNCTAYTTGASTGRSTGGQLAKWQGVEFMCDMVNPLRNVVGTGSKGGRNSTTVTSLSTGPHRYFLTYTENNSKPDFTLFSRAINSFKVNQ